MTILTVFDTETTGLWNNRSKNLDKQPWTVELFAEKVVLETGEVLKEFHSHFHPGVNMEAEAMKVTGLTNEFLSDKPFFSEKIEEIKEMFLDADMIGGQNLPFDLTMLSFDFRRCKQVFSYEGKRLYDTVEANEFRFGYRPKLIDLYESFFGERFSNAHEAKVDVNATTRIILELHKRGEI